MPHGRPRKSSSKYRAVDKLTAKRKPHGYLTWLAFAAETFVPPPYFTETKDGRRFKVLNQDPASVRRVMQVEWEMVREVSKQLIHERVKAAGGLIEDAPHYAWIEANDPRSLGGSAVLAAAELLDGWQVPFDVGLSWCTLHAWKKVHQEWRREKGLATD